MLMKNMRRDRSARPNTSHVESLGARIGPRWDAGIRHRRRVAAWVTVAASLIGAFVLVNVGASGYASFVVKTSWTPYRSATAGTLAAFYYIVPLLAVALLHDQFATGRQKPWRAVLAQGRFLLLVSAASYLGSVSLAFAWHGAMGARPEAGDLVQRPIIGLAGLLLFAVPTILLVAFVARAVGDPDRAMLAGMITLLIVGVFVSLLSDFLLVAQLGPQPVAGTSAWSQYLKSLQTAPGILIYVFSPGETYLAVLGGAIGETALTAQRAASVLGVTASPLFALLPVYGVLGAIGRRRTRRNSTTPVQHISQPREPVLEPVNQR